jgi:hypothetical protein
MKYFQTFKKAGAAGYTKLMFRFMSKTAMERTMRKLNDKDTALVTDGKTYYVYEKVL